MKVIGKIIGALVGLWLFRHPFGIVLGGLIGHLWDIGALRPLGMQRARGSFIGRCSRWPAPSPNPTAACPNRKLPRPKT
jgi:hypothetical protein